MIEPKEITLKTQKGDEKRYIISKFPAVAGREIITKYPVSNVPKLGDYQQSEDVMLKAISYTAVVMPDGTPLQLTTRALVDNHLPDWETLVKLEWAQVEYNVSFFGEGRNSGFLESISQRGVAWITKTLIPLLVASLQTGKPPSTS